MHPLPESVEKAVRSLSSGSPIDMCVESDVGSDGVMGPQWLVTTADRIYVVTPDHRDPLVVHNVAISDISEINAEPLVGSGCVVANIKGDYVPLVRYSNSVAKEFGHAARRLQARIEGEEPPATTDEDRTRRCPNCAFPLETGSDVCPNCVNKGRAIKRLLAYVRPYRKLTTIAALLMIGAQGLMLAPPYLTKVLIDDVLRPAEETTASGALRGQLLHLLGLIVLALVVTRLIATVMGIVQARMTAFIGSKIIHDIRMQLYSSLERLTVGFFDKRQTGAIISRLSQDTNSLQGFLSHDLQFVISNTLILMLVLVVLFVDNWKLAALTIFPAPIATIVATMISKRLRWIFRRVWHRWSKLHGVMSDSLQGLRVVKAFAQEEREIDRFRRRSRDLYLAHVEAEQIWATFLPIMWFALTAGQFIVWYAGGLGVIDGGVSTGTLVMFIGYIGMLYQPLQIVTRMWDWLARCLAASERIFEIMDSQREEADPDSTVRVPDVKGRVKLSRVTFGYDKNRPVLHNIDLEVEPGEMIGLCGHSGAGKSTLINLLARFYIAQEGLIEIDGVDIRSISLEDLRTQIGIVPQECYLFSGSVMDNIAYAKQGATTDEIIRAAKAANAHDFIVSMSDGYETHVGERGHSLSGGERQRIAIARAILHDPRILILDEATSSVDTGTEKDIQEALARLVQNRTTLAIAHRLSTLRHANRLLVLDKGKVAELGTHSELLAKPGGIYSKLVELQTEMSKVVAVGG